MPWAFVNFYLPFLSSILDADIVNFTPLSEKLSASELVSTLNQLFGRFDQIAQVSISVRMRTVKTFFLFSIFSFYRARLVKRMVNKKFAIFYATF